MSNSINPIKALVQRFVSLQPAVRMKVTKRLLELYGSDQAESAATGSCSVLVKKSFLEQFWDEVEKAHGDAPQAVNPFTPQGRADVEATPDAPVQNGYLHWCRRPSDLFALL